MRSPAGSHVTVGGMQLTGASGEEPELVAEDPFALPAWVDARREEASRSITGRDLVLGTRFHLSSADGAQAPGPAFTMWGQVAQSGFEAEEYAVALDGDVTTGLVGFDAEWDRALAGEMLSQSSGDGTYRLDAEAGTDGGRVESDLTGVYPYARLDLNARVSAWALAGAGSGGLTLERDSGETMPSDLSMRMGALGMEGQVLEPGAGGGLSLSVKSDTMWVQTKTSRTQEMRGTGPDFTDVEDAHRDAPLGTAARDAARGVRRRTTTAELAPVQWTRDPGRASGDPCPVSSSNTSSGPPRTSRNRST